MRLFHVSEGPDIAEFLPRPVGTWDARLSGNAVWAIAETHLPNYLLPRECPRVTYTRDNNTSAADAGRFFGASRAGRIVAIERDWLERAQTTPIYLYEMPPEKFSCIDVHAGHFVAHEAVRPLSIRRVDNPIEELLKHDVELRIIQDILALHDAVKVSTLSFSSTRLRNARRASV